MPDPQTAPSNVDCILPLGCAFEPDCHLACSFKAMEPVPGVVIARVVVPLHQRIAELERQLAERSS